MIVWRLVAKIVRTVLCCTVCDVCAQWYEHVRTVLKFAYCLGLNCIFVCLFTLCIFWVFLFFCVSLHRQGLGQSPLPLSLHFFTSPGELLLYLLVAYLLRFCFPFLTCFIYFLVFPSLPILQE